ncbi:MAG: heme-binding protein [Rhodospirillales bacterium]|nr:heme-binding protein [Rhodospirillales bacterium]MBO6785462.1 heme-binding protein [Rhodospirillales bacterium]
MTLTLEQASKIVDGAHAYGAENDFDPLTVAVLDAGGHLVAFKRADGSGILRPEIAMGKAYGALGFGLDGRALKEKNPTFLGAVAAASGGRMVPVPGGVLVRDGSGAIIGAVGISGDNSGNDELAAIAGIEGAGLAITPALKG